MSTENTPTHAASQRAIRQRLLAAALALVAGTAAVLIAVLYLNGVLG
ncbi:MAG TPA: hypothetical protein VMU39_16565 [Solirubrobacteraceae bacterium]|nr:hypothetical protein [Solirubrobacteraceae bacterium]